MTASNGLHGSDWSPVTTRSRNFNIDDYISSDDESFTTPDRKPRPTAEGEEDLLFKTGYGITGAALPGLEALGEETEYSAISKQNKRNDSVSTQGSAAVASSPKDNRRIFVTDCDLSPTLRHVRSDPEDLYMSTFGRLMMGALQRPSTANAWEANEGPGNTPPEEEQHDGTYTPSGSSSYSDEPRSEADMKSTVGSLGGLRPQRSESSFSVYSGGGTVTTTITGGAKATTTGWEDNNTYDGASTRAPRRGLKRLSALGTLYGRSSSVGSFGASDRGRPATAAGASDGCGVTMSSREEEEMRASDIIRRRKEDKNRKRSDGGLRSIREKRLTEAFGRPDHDGIARLREHLRDRDELWGSGE
jgi:hypothetical protein